MVIAYWPSEAAMRSSTEGWATSADGCMGVRAAVDAISAVNMRAGRGRVVAAVTASREHTERRCANRYALTLAMSGVRADLSITWNGLPMRQ